MWCKLAMWGMSEKKTLTEENNLKNVEKEGEEVQKPTKTKTRQARDLLKSFFTGAVHNFFVLDMLFFFLNSHQSNAVQSLNKKLTL